RAPLSTPSPRRKVSLSLCEALNVQTPPSPSSSEASNAGDQSPELRRLVYDPKGGVLRAGNCNQNVRRSSVMFQLSQAEAAAAAVLSRKASGRSFCSSNPAGSPRSPAGSDQGSTESFNHCYSPSPLSSSEAVMFGNGITAEEGDDEADSSDDDDLFFNIGK
ncbi:unnamed protein product, partial [Chrysoparadoxa australica]